MALDDSQSAMFLLRTSYGIVRATHFMRTTPFSCWQAQGERFDREVRKVAEAILGTPLDDRAWAQAALTPSLGGLGLRRIVDLTAGQTRESWLTPARHALVSAVLFACSLLTYTGTTPRAAKRTQISSCVTIESETSSPGWLMRVSCLRFWKREASWVTPSALAAGRATSRCLVGGIPRGWLWMCASLLPFLLRTCLLQILLTTTASGSTESTMKGSSKPPSISVPLLLKRPAA
jgi:hypothetical protein